MQRRRLRLEGFDYATAGAYFVTVCTRDRRCVLGHVADGRFVSSATGRLVREALEGIGAYYDGVELDSFVVMPNHVHFILLLDWTTLRVPAIPAVVGAFKARASRRVGVSLWQRSYHDRVVRDERELTALREYIQQNPTRWALDRENLARRSSR
jgi:REP element-mobilizing transposase RayT